MAVRMSIGRVSERESDALGSGYSSLRMKDRRTTKAQGQGERSDGSPSASPKMARVGHRARAHRHRPLWSYPHLRKHPTLKISASTHGRDRVRHRRRWSAVPHRRPDQKRSLPRTTNALETSVSGQLSSEIIRISVTADGVAQRGPQIHVEPVLAVIVGPIHLDIATLDCEDPELTHLKCARVGVR